MSLAEHLRELKVDDIEDDQEFCDAEHAAIIDYCEKHKYDLSSEDMDEIINRGYENAFPSWKENYEWFNEEWREK